MSNPWKLVRKLAEIIKNDDTDALEYIDKDFSLEGISSEDSYEFSSKIAEYRKWLADFEEYFHEECVNKVPEMRPINREEFLNISSSNIAFAEITSAGGMGCGGEVHIYLNDLSSYEFNIVYGNDITEKDLMKKIPAYKKNILNENPEECILPKGWKMFYIGMGTFLLYRSKYDSDFKERCVLLDNEHDRICANLKDIIFDILMQ